MRNQQQNLIELIKKEGDELNKEEIKKAKVPKVKTAEYS